MTTTTSDTGSGARSSDADWFAIEWLHGSPDATVRTVPVIAVVDELLSMLRDEQVPQQQAYHALRRAVRLLSAFAAEPLATQRTQPEDSWQVRGVAGRVFTAQELAASDECRRFAKETLRGSPQRAIRTEPVIAVVAELRSTLLAAHPPQRAHIAVRRAVRLLAVYVIDDEQDPNQAA